MPEKFCSECNCKGEPMDLGEGKVHQEKNWDCPLLKTKICETCCQVDLAGGMGAGDTLRETVQKTGKTTAEILVICVACEHGGPGLVEPHALLMARGKDGTMKSSGPEFEAADKEFKEQWQARLEQLKNPGADSPDEAKKISLDKAEKIIDAICDLMETEPLQLINGRTGYAVKNLAQQIEDIGRPKAAARILKGWEILKDSILKGSLPGDNKRDRLGSET